MKQTACIITGGEISPGFLKKIIKNYEGALLIVVDGALEVADATGLVPGYIVGDFDTVNPEVLKKYPEEIILRHPPEKDQTDTELAVDTAVSCGCNRVILLGAIGSRLDHSLANIFLLERMAGMGIEAVIYNENNKLYLKDRSFCIKKSEQYGAFVSLLPLTGRVENVTLDGLKYSLRNRGFNREDTLGISNEITADEATIDFSEGMFLVVESKDK